MIDPRGLQTFHAVCEAGSISAAARLLNISQPSVSSAIALLEARLGVRLFERSRAGITLTPEGKALSDRARMLDNLLRDAEAEVALARQGITGPLRIGGTPGALVSLLPTAVSRLDAMVPRLALHVLERADGDLVGLLRDGGIELAFVTTDIEEPPPDIAERTFTRDPFALIVGKESTLPDRMALADAHGLNWVLPEAQGAFRRQVDALFHASGVPMPSDIIRCDSLLTTKALVRDVGRVTILPMRVAAAELSMGVLRAITIAEASFERSVGVRWLIGRGLSPLAKVMLEQLGQASID